MLENLLSTALRYTDAQQAQDLLLAVSGFFVISAALVKVIKRPISFGTAFIWERLDALRDARMVPYWTLYASTNIFKGLTALVWGICGIGVVWMAMQPQSALSAMTAPFAVDTFRQDHVARVTDFFDAVARGATALLLGVSAFVIATISIFLFQIFALRNKEFKGSSLSQSIFHMAILILMAYFASAYMRAFIQNGLFIIGTFGPSYYQAFLIQMSGFSIFDILFGAFFGAFILTTMVLFSFVVWGLTANVYNLFKKQLKHVSRNPQEPKGWFDSIMASTYVFGGAVILSFFATASAGHIGLSFTGKLDTTLTFQLLAINALFDGLTLATTLRLMVWAAEPLPIRAARLQLSHHEKMLKTVGIAHTFLDVADTPIELRLRLDLYNNQDPFYCVSQDVISNFLKWHEERRLVCSDAMLRWLSSLRFDASKFSDVDTRNKIHARLLDLATTNQPRLSKFEKLLRWRLPIALIVDVIAAFVFCLAVLWLGLIGTPAAMDWAGIWHVATGGFNAGTFTEIGPLFWITHTTFIPTILIWVSLLIMLFLCSGISRAVDRLIRLRPATNVSAEAQRQIERARMALTKTATVFGSLAASIYALDYAGLWVISPQ